MNNDTQPQQKPKPHPDVIATLLRRAAANAEELIRQGWTQRDFAQALAQVLDPTAPSPAPSPAPARTRGRPLEDSAREILQMFTRNPGNTPEQNRALASLDVSLYHHTHPIDDMNADTPAPNFKVY